MEEYFDALAQAFAEYRQDLEDFQKKSRPTDGLLGFGRSLKNDSCHDRFDEKVEKIIGGLCAASPAPDTAERAAAILLTPEYDRPWPVSAEWMLRAAERHALGLIPFLTPAAAERLLKAYGARYKRWDRLPAQNTVFEALRKRAKEK